MFDTKLSKTIAKQEMIMTFEQIEIKKSLICFASRQSGKHSQKTARICPPEAACQFL